MKFAAIVLLSCVALVASNTLELKPAFPSGFEPAPQNDVQCASVCLWSGIYSFPSFQNCRQYIHCVHGFQFILECQPWEFFDHRTLSCENETEARCILQGIPVESQKA